MSPRRRSYSGWNDDYDPPTRPLHADGIRAQHRSGAFAKSWWAGRWIAALERLVDSGRLARGRSYARQGQVLDITIEPGKVSARVQGSRPTPYRVVINVMQLTAQEWDRVLLALAQEAIFTAQLLDGQMPPNIETVFTAAQAPLFPERRNDLATSCSCPDAANPCKHIAAVYYLLGERFDEDPFLIFRLRGRTREEVLGALRAMRAGGAAGQTTAAEMPAADGLPVEEQLVVFWQAGAPLDHFTVSIAAPEVGALLLKRLGAPPLGQEAAEMNAILTRTYAQVTSRALELAFGEDETDEDAV